MVSHFWKNAFLTQFVKNAGRIIIRLENAGSNSRIFFSGPGFRQWNSAERIQALKYMVYYKMKQIANVCSRFYRTLNPEPLKSSDSDPDF